VGRGPPLSGGIASSSSSAPPAGAWMDDGDWSSRRLVTCVVSSCTYVRVRRAVRGCESTSRIKNYFFLKKISRYIEFYGTVCTKY